MEPRHTVVGRVLRRRTFSSNVLFLDVMVTALDGAPTAGPAVLSCCVSCAPGVTEPPLPGAIPRPAPFYADKAVFARAKGEVRPGDAVLARGAFEAEAASSQGEWTKGMRVADVALLEKWEPRTTGTFHLRASQAKGVCAAPAKPVTAASLQAQGALPGLVLQVPDAFVDRVVSYLRLKYGVSRAAEIYPSLTELSNTAERHVLVSADVAAAHAALHDELVGDPNLCGHLMRIYRFDGPRAQAFATAHELAAWVASPERFRV